MFFSKKQNIKNLSSLCVGVSLLSLVLIFGFFPEVVSAQGETLIGAEYLGGSGLPSTSPIVIVARIINVILGILGIITTVLIFYAGFLWLTSAGNDDKIDQAKRTISAAVIGLILVLSSYAISRFALRSVYRSTTGNQYPTSLIEFR